MITRSRACVLHWVNFGLQAAKTQDRSFDSPHGALSHIFVTSAEGGYIFTSVCLSVCLSVCHVRRITEKVVNGF